LRHRNQGDTRLERIAAWNVMQCGAVSVRPAVLPYELARSAILKSVKIAGSNRNHGRKDTTEASNMVSLV
jgi:hypothetical protein